MLKSERLGGTNWISSGEFLILSFYLAICLENLKIGQKKVVEYQNDSKLSSTQPSVQHTPQFNTLLSSTQKGHSFSAPSIPHFNTRLSSTLPSVQHQKNVSMLNWRVFGVELRTVLNWGGCRSEGCVELRGCGTEGYVLS